MYICLCFGVSDSNVKKAIADGASTIAEIQKKSNAGKKCGACLMTLQDLLDLEAKSKISNTQKAGAAVSGAVKKDAHIAP